ncbi:MAG TPA: methyltransferase domain-containing protein [Thermoanaerobaculia bacterium]|nr:methyltransferase domain-containing protein [Thermoanaerobaculia bacterium]
MTLFKKKPVRLHIGSGDKRLDGWVNIDLKPLPGVDVVADVTQGLEFDHVEAVFAEHFLEHLRVDHALRFLREAHRVLMPGGVIRLSTPNLDWVLETHYRADAPPREKLMMTVRLNRAFHGWGHQFLWNRETLALALAACGFSEPRWCRYGESDMAVFQGLERHETYGDSDQLPHVIIAEATRLEAKPAEYLELAGLFERELIDHLAG